MIARDILDASPAELAAVHAAYFADGWSAGAFASILAMPGTFGTAEGDRGRLGIDGFILCRRAADEVEILTLAVVPLYRRRGLARRLLAGAMATAGSTGAVRFHLEVASDNAAAGALYRAAGFTEVGRRAAYYRRTGGPAVDAVLWSAAIS